MLMEREAMDGKRGIGIIREGSVGTRNKTRQYRPLWGPPQDPASAQSHVPGWPPRCWHKMAPLAREATAVSPWRWLRGNACGSHPASDEKGHLGPSAGVSEGPSQASSTEILGLSTQIHRQQSHVVNQGFTVIISQEHLNMGECRF